MASLMSREEAAAKAIVESLLPGAAMHWRSSQAAGEHDFDLEYPGGVTVPLEVTVATSEVAERTRAAILRSRLGRVVSRTLSVHDWYVYPSRGAHINKIRAVADRYLAAIEADGLEQFSALVDASRWPSVRAILEDLGIEWGSVVKWKSPGIRIALPADGGLVDAKLVNGAVETEALKPDNRRKLDSVKVSEKHLFVYVATTKHVLWVAVRDGCPPSVGPQLPPEITDVWVATWAGDGAWHTVWRVHHASPWSHMGQVNIETGERIAV